ncbi:MAG: hypothetical protein IPN29_17180 [Saprospiraceae bacterium]|nr:hypothetical protein [Saprospiraceae bacterium]
MDNSRNQSYLKRNIIWFLLLLMTISLAAYFFGRKINNPPIELTATIPDPIIVAPTPGPSPPTAVKLLDPSPVFVDSAFLLQLDQVNIGNNQISYFIDNSIVCQNQNICKVSIPKKGKSFTKSVLC